MEDEQAEITWIQATEEKSVRRRVPAWKTRAGLAKDGTVYLPAAICGNENAVMMSASWDGVSLLTWSGHIYLPADWLAGEYPDHAEDVNYIAERVRQCARDEPKKEAPGS